MLGCAPHRAPASPAPPTPPEASGSDPGSAVRFDRPKPATRPPRAVQLSASGATLRPTGPPAPPSGARISIDVIDADLHHVLRLISDVAGLAFVVDDGVSARVTARLVDVPWDHALAAILAAHGLTTQPLAGGGVQVRGATP